METYNNAASIARIPSAIHLILNNVCACTYERLSLLNLLATSNETSTRITEIPG